jgi:hypothetical protein
LSGNREEIIKNLDQVLSEIGQVNNITVHVQVDVKSRIVYSISEEATSRTKRAGKYLRILKVTIVA